MISHLAKDPNLYGPGDNFDLESSHVIPAIIKKCVEAKRGGAEKIIAWGTGEVSREFLYVEDAAEGILLAAQRYDNQDPVNIGSGEETSIRDLVALIIELVGFEGWIEWDHLQPDGQPRQKLDTSRAKQEFGFEAKTSLRAGLQRTIEYYKSTYAPG